MSQFDPLLVPLDGSELAAGAARVARTLCRGTGDSTRLLNVLDTDAPNPDIGTPVVRDARVMLEEEAARFHTPVQVQVEFGAPAESVRRVAEEAGVGLLVMTPRGRGALASVLFGSVSRELLIGCRVPTLLVHGVVNPGAPVVVGVDAGANAPVVVGAARILSEALGAALHVVHVINADVAVARHPERYNINPELWRTATREAAERTFTQVREGYPAGAVEVVRYGIAVEELARYATEVSAGLVVVGRRGASGNDLDSFFSVAFGLASRGGASVLIV